MDFVNEHWGNPLLHEDENGDLILDNGTPPELDDLKWSDLPYVCLIMTHTQFGKSQSRTIRFAHVDGSVSIYLSPKSLSKDDGMMAFLVDETVPAPNRDRIVKCWNWLVHHNPLYEGLAVFPHEMAEPIGLAAIEREQGSVPRPSQGHPQQAMFPASVLATLEPGPRAADVNMEDLDVGLDINKNELVKFSNPKLMAMLFPELFPYGNGAFSLWHHKTKLRENMEDDGAEDENDDDDEIDDGADIDGNDNDPGENVVRELPVMSIRAYAKYRLLHFDRTFTKNPRFITFMADWVNKNACYGYRLRTTSQTRGVAQRVTTAQDILQGMIT
ncbi:hypothetical protein EDD21DRAFT_85927 [Dissophora ornata]|nr:hypothetical protein EDD21DRAFT_85927 [Dissophora ornata]